MDRTPGLARIALKMATGTGKTVVMAMLIAWHALNKIANPKDSRFSDTFLVVTPGITIRDRLRVLWPHDAENYYRLRDLVPPDLIGQLGRAKILITNFHAFKIRKLIETNKLTKEILGTEFDDSPAQMVNRVCREVGTKKNIVVINDEAHHCYRRKPDGEVETLKGEERTAAEKRNEEARVWISGLEAVRDKIGIRGFYDLSATPFFLRGSGYSGRRPLSLGRLRLLAHRRHRVGHRQDSPRSRRRRHDAGGSADLPLPLDPHPRGTAPQGPANRSGRRRAQAAGRAARRSP